MAPVPTKTSSGGENLSLSRTLNMKYVDTKRKTIKKKSALIHLVTPATLLTFQSRIHKGTDLP